MEQRIRISFGSAILVLVLGAAGGLVASTLVAARAYRARWSQATQKGQDITVKGSARKRIHSDVGVWKIRVAGDAAQMDEAYQTVKDGVGRVRAFLDARGFLPDEITLGPVRTETHYGRDEEGHRTRDVTGYTLDRAFRINTGRVALVAAAAGEVTELIEQGIHVVSFRPEYYYSKLASMKIDMMASASRDARSRADQIASNTGCRVGDVREARMGVLQITSPHSTEVSGSGIYDTSTIEKDIRAVVTVTFGIVMD